MNENKFDGKEKLYAQFRPAYPKAFLDYLYADTGLTTKSTLADIGSGTGIFTKQLLERGSNVYGVEPNADMRRAAEAALAEFSEFTSINGTAEHTTLAEHSVDCITVAQAFHWFDHQRFKEECRRILKQPGVVILVWNSRDENSGLVRENDAVNRLYCSNYMGFSGGLYGTAMEEHLADFFCGAYEAKRFENNLLLNLEGFIGRNLSASYAPQKSDQGYDLYINELKALFKKHSVDGVLTMPNTTCSYVGTV